MDDRAIEDLRPSQVPPPLLAHAAGEVAGAGAAVLDLAGGGQAEAFFGSLVGLLLGHEVTWLTDRGIVGESETSHYREGAAETKEGALADEDCDLARPATLHTA